MKTKTYINVENEYDWNRLIKELQTIGYYWGEGAYQNVSVNYTNTYPMLVLGDSEQEPFRLYREFYSNHDKVYTVYDYLYETFMEINLAYVRKIIYEN